MRTTSPTDFTGAQSYYPYPDNLSNGMKSQIYDRVVEVPVESTKIQVVEKIKEVPVEVIKYVDRDG